MSLSLYARRRRELLAAVVASVAASRAIGAVKTDESVAAAAQTLRRYIALRARLDGQVVYSIARGTDTAIVEGSTVPLRGQIILQITRAIDRGSGGWEMPYVEGTLTTEPGTFRYLPELTNPLTGETRPTARPGVYLARLRMDATGVLGNHVELPDGTVIDYSGKVGTQAGLEGQPWATQSLRIRIARPSLAVEDAQVSTTYMATGEARHGFVPSDAMSSSFRATLPAALGQGRTGSLVSTFFGRKYATLDSLRRSMEPEHVALFGPLFEQWQGLLP